jgi:hypothetical protein
LFKVEKPTPKSSATGRRESPLVSATRTAFLRDSSVLPVPMVHLICCTIGDQGSGTKLRQVQITVYDDEATRLRTAPSGAAGLIAKPLDFTLLRAEIERRLPNRGNPPRALFSWWMTSRISRC